MDAIENVLLCAFNGCVNLLMMALWLVAFAVFTPQGWMGLCVVWLLLFFR